MPVVRAAPDETTKRRSAAALVQTSALGLDVSIPPFPLIGIGRLLVFLELSCSILSSPTDESRLSGPSCCSASAEKTRHCDAVSHRALWR